jgi:hypothetical protein
MNVREQTCFLLSIQVLWKELELTLNLSSFPHPANSGCAAAKKGILTEKKPTTVAISARNGGSYIISG